MTPSQYHREEILTEGKTRPEWNTKYQFELVQFYLNSAVAVKHTTNPLSTTQGQVRGLGIVTSIYSPQLSCGHHKNRSQRHRNPKE